MNKAFSQRDKGSYFQYSWPRIMWQVDNYPKNKSCYFAYQKVLEKELHETQNLYSFNLYPNNNKIIILYFTGLKF